MGSSLGSSGSTLQIASNSAECASAGCLGETSRGTASTTLERVDWRWRGGFPDANIAATSEALVLENLLEPLRNDAGRGVRIFSLIMVLIACK